MAEGLDDGDDVSSHRLDAALHLARRRADAAVADGDDVPLLGEPVHEARVPVVEVRTEVRQRDEGDAGPRSRLAVDDVCPCCRDCRHRGVYPSLGCALLSHVALLGSSGRRLIRVDSILSALRTSVKGGSRGISAREAATLAHVVCAILHLSMTATRSEGRSTEDVLARIRAQVRATVGPRTAEALYTR